ncbi:MAG: DNA polymerase III subunit epsilon [Sutterellaceae bacterium]|nr:DNA polymerase III subunit epsilon [Burkholderiaceae bacterium]MCX7901062.1 DNA polymerase III subunit epsilon [Burkholderiaceae bacterium]MDW8430388.1 DNA polymerase III subunit epsilon [Sutterellaceae bacterium]
MRQVVLDTETTGLDPKDGHRIIEIGALEIVGRRLTERRLHHYLNPERDIDPGALAVHGIDNEFLRDKPKFADIACELLDFVRDAEVIIHNAAFDLEFLDAELARVGLPPFATHCAKVTDSLALARELHPGKRNSLDALCERYQVNHAHRTLHGALLDAGLLAEVYLAMTRGQDALAMELDVVASAEELGPLDGADLLVLPASAEEAAAHEAILDRIAKEAKVVVWRAAAA